MIRILLQEYAFAIYSGVYRTQVTAPEEDYQNMALPADIENRTSNAPTHLIRSLGSLERLIYRYAEGNPVNFCLVVEFGMELAAAHLQAALSAVQQRHPLLSAHVEDVQHARLCFFRSPQANPIAVAVYRGRAEDWRTLAADELVRPFDHSVAPLVRAVLASDAGHSVVILTFDHSVADGISSIKVAGDLVASLNGHTLERLSTPPSQEELIEMHLPPLAEVYVPEPSPDPRMSIPTTIRPFDGAPPCMHTIAMSISDTARLVQRCRAERTSVHSAIVVAASDARSNETDDDFVRTYSPINIRSLVGVDGDCADCLGAAVSGVTPNQPHFWARARAVTEGLSAARSIAGTVAGSAGIQLAGEEDAELDDAQRFFTEAAPFDMLISNLGVQDFPASGPMMPTAVWGPLFQAHVDGEYVIGIVTHGGRLRMITCGYQAPVRFLHALRATLVDQCR